MTRLQTSGVDLSPSEKVTQSFDKTQLLVLSDASGSSAADSAPSLAPDERDALTALVEHYIASGQLREAVRAANHFQLEHEELRRIRVSATTSNISSAQFKRFMTQKYSITSFTDQVFFFPINALGLTVLILCVVKCEADIRQANLCFRRVTRWPPMRTLPTSRLSALLPLCAIAPYRVS